MNLRDVASRISIDRRKLTEYALNPENLTGGADKAVLFQKYLGFTRENYEILLEQIGAQALEAEAILGRIDQFGVRYTVDLVIIGIAGQQEILRTGWIVAPEDDVARLTTLYVLRRRR